MWLWVYYKKIPINPIFYLLNGDYIYICIWVDCTWGLRKNVCNVFSCMAAIALWGVLQMRPVGPEGYMSDSVNSLKGVLQGII